MGLELEWVDGICTCVSTPIHPLQPNPPTCLFSYTRPSTHPPRPLPPSPSSWPQHFSVSHPPLSSFCVQVSGLLLGWWDVCGSPPSSSSLFSLPHHLTIHALLKVHTILDEGGREAHDLPTHPPLCLSGPVRVVYPRHHRLWANTHSWGRWVGVGGVVPVASLLLLSSSFYLLLSLYCCCLLLGLAKVTWDGRWVGWWVE